MTTEQSGASRFTLATEDGRSDSVGAKQLFATISMARYGFGDEKFRVWDLAADSPAEVNGFKSLALVQSSPSDYANRL